MLFRSPPPALPLLDMRFLTSGLLVFIGALAFNWSLCSAHAHSVHADVLSPRSSPSQCTPFESSFAPGDVSGSPGASFLALSPPGSYSTAQHGLQLYLTKPPGKVTATDGVNNVVGAGATVNSTFAFLYGRVTYTLSAPTVAGVVTAAILIGISSFSSMWL